MAADWGHDLENAQRWMTTAEYNAQKELGRKFINLAPTLVEKVEKKFGQKLIGEIRLSPSLMRFDGFARYDSGSHVVWFGVDHPDADDDYLKVLLSHELSHVYRDHQPQVWKFLNKPLEKVSRQEYLDASTAAEHLASEGLATLFSQIMFPEVPLHVHHYYLPHEMTWCLQNIDKIGKSIFECQNGDENIWSFYAEDRVETGSPSRTQYFWAAHQIKNWVLKTHPNEYEKRILELHGWESGKFDCLKSPSVKS